MKAKVNFDGRWLEVDDLFVRLSCDICRESLTILFKEKPHEKH